MKSSIRLKNITVSSLGLAPEELPIALVPGVTEFVIGIVEGGVKVGLDDVGKVFDVLV